jgi:hypothetical protein
MSYSKVYWEFGSAAKASSVTVHSANLTAGNIAAQEGLRAAFEAAVDGLTLGNPGSEQWTATATAVAKNPAAAEEAQRENKWLVSFVDDVTGLGGSYTVPCADLSLLGGDGQYMDTASAEYIALVAASDAFVLSNAGNATSVTSVKFSARTLG